MRIVQRHPVAAFVVLALTLSWAAWLPLLAQTQGWVGAAPRRELHLLGSLGPAAAAVVVVGCTRGVSGLADLGRRLTAWRGRRAAWVFALLVPVVLLVVTVPLAAWAAGTAPDDVEWTAFGRSTEFAGMPLVAYWLANLVFFGAGEEVGWRGFLQPRLERRHARVTAAGLVGLVWAAWHLPLFGITPSYRAMPLVGFVGFAMSIWVASWIFAWLLHLGRGSLLVVAVFHAWFDVATNSPVGVPGLPTAMGAAVTVLGLWVLRRLLRSAGPDAGRQDPADLSGADRP
ncbi:CPBP family intramembrane glutamic endopeptidase [Modestobacter sp. SSW1-42]|uniref:CPBP family intramembrane glutamic endopeptidase n=1 Tax=Modestobacter sp. SSW1-42 TaxID=596372 RepID=UPI0039863AB7